MHGGSSDAYRSHIYRFGGSAFQPLSGDELTTAARQRQKNTASQYKAREPNRRKPKVARVMGGPMSPLVSIPNE
jgi:hypothetical protein